MTDRFYSKTSFKLFLIIGMFVVSLLTMSFNFTPNVAYATLSPSSVAGQVVFEYAGIDPDNPVVAPDSPEETVSDVAEVGTSAQLANTGDVTNYILLSVLLISVLIALVVFVSRRCVACVSTSGNHSNDIKSFSKFNILIVGLLSLSLLFGSIFSAIKAYAEIDKPLLIESKVIVNTDGTIESTNIVVKNVSKTDITCTSSLSIGGEESITGWTTNIVSNNTVIHPGESLSGIWNTGSNVLPDAILNRLKAGEEIRCGAGVNIQLSTFEMNWNANGGDGDINKRLVEGDTPDLPSVEPTREGFKFVGWNTKSDGTGDTVDAEYLQNHPLTQDTTYYAKWETA